jgi:Flp pilus assembly protein CpaB
MHRSPRVILLWVVAVVVAIGTARVVGGDLSALHRRARALGPDVHVLLAQRDLSLGTRVDMSDVRVVVRPSSTVPSDAVRASQPIAGRVLLVSLFRDDVVRAVDLASDGRTGLDGVVPVGRRAVHLIVKDGFRPPVGAVVDVFAAADPTAAGPSTETGTGAVAIAVARGARVLAVDDPASAGSGSGSAVTVLVTEAEAPAVAFAASNSQVSLALAPPEDACCNS